MSSLRRRLTHLGARLAVEALRIPVALWLALVIDLAVARADDEAEGEP